MSIKTQRLLERAKKFSKKGKYDDAKNLYEEILKDLPNNAEANKALVLLEEIKNTSRAPRAELQKVVALYSDEKITKALKVAEVLIKQFPNEPVLFNISGACYKAKNNLEHAINVLVSCVYTHHGLKHIINVFLLQFYYNSKNVINVTLVLAKCIII